GQRARERPERLPVPTAHEDQVLAALARGLGGAAQVIYQGQIGREGTRTDLRRHAVDPDGSLAVRGRVVDPADEVPREGPPVGRGSDTGGPAPVHMPLVVGGGVVDDRAGVDRARLTVDPNHAASADAALLTGPRVVVAAAANGL